MVGRGGGKIRKGEACSTVYLLIVVVDVCSDSGSFPVASLAMRLDYPLPVSIVQSARRRPELKVAKRIRQTTGAADATI